MEGQTEDSCDATVRIMVEVILGGGFELDYVMEEIPISSIVLHFS